MIPGKIHWLERALLTNKFYRDKKRIDESWTIENAAEALHRSSGSVSEDLLIASWFKTHEPQIMQCKTQQEALQFIRKKRRELNLS